MPGSLVLCTDESRELSKEDGGNEVVGIKEAVFWGNKTGLKYGLETGV